MNPPFTDIFALRKYRLLDITISLDRLQAAADTTSMRDVAAAKEENVDADSEMVRRFA